MKKKKYMLGVMGKDQPGIIGAVTNILSQKNCNLEDVSMTILEDQFAMMLIFESGQSKEALEKKLSMGLKKYKLSFSWNEMKKSSLKSKHSKSAKTLVVTAMGRDRAGIVSSVSGLLAKKKLNITDLNCKILDQGLQKPLYALVLEVDVPRSQSVMSLKRSFASLSKRLKMDISVQPLEQVEF